MFLKINVNILGLVHRLKIEKCNLENFVGFVGSVALHIFNPPHIYFYVY